MCGMGGRMLPEGWRELGDESPRLTRGPRRIRACNGPASVHVALEWDVDAAPPRLVGEIYDHLGLMPSSTRIVYDADGLAPGRPGDELWFMLNPEVAPEVEAVAAALWNEGPPASPPA
ncbi:hypothetical protein CLV46_0915 [Diaminobutyricimonas aerilata]|uniref:Uncharacterized protein n=2 Tax=Diaminobutyricimonas aerilata TaxID=1162967 RepID=A0A2M9CHM1_9MICO|nr:hypothetical protein CLV46_0915 [Diaminobutyricimonas aerilata]